MLVRNILGLAMFSLALGVAGAPAQALSAKECSVKYKAAQQAGTLGDMKWNDFRKAQCGADASAQPVAAPMGGASDCNCCKASAYSGGKASGMVASSCATFIIGPFRPPKALANTAALSAPPPNREAAAMRAATPPALAPTRA